MTEMTDIIFIGIFLYAMIGLGGFLGFLLTNQYPNKSSSIGLFDIAMCLVFAFLWPGLLSFITTRLILRQFDSKDKPA